MRFTYARGQCGKKSHAPLFVRHLLAKSQVQVPQSRVRLKTAEGGGWEGKVQRVPACCPDGVWQQQQQQQALLD